MEYEQQGVGVLAVWERTGLFATSEEHEVELKHLDSDFQERQQDLQKLQYVSINSPSQTAHMSRSPRQLHAIPRQPSEAAIYGCILHTQCVKYCAGKCWQPPSSNPQKQRPLWIHLPPLTQQQLPRCDTSYSLRCMPCLFSI